MCISQQIVVSCEWTWLRRCYLWNDRNREWWFTGRFLQQKPLFLVSSHHSQIQSLRPQPLCGPKQRHTALTVSPWTNKAVSCSHLSNIHNMEIFVTGLRIIISSTIRAQRLTPQFGQKRTYSVCKSAFLMLACAPSCWHNRYVLNFTLSYMCNPAIIRATVPALLCVHM